MIELSDGGGVTARVLAYGATLASLEVPDRNGRPGEILLGFDDEARYRGAHPHFGGTIGRYANRIANARCRLAGQTLELPRNDGAHHLHGGPGGFDRLDWSYEADARSCELRLVSPNGDAGFPGQLEVCVRYVLEETALTIDFTAETDAPTFVNLTNHAYFNLRDGGASSVLDHVLWVDAEHYLPVDADGIPSGEQLSVEGTPFDFRRPKPLGERVERIYDGRGGYDHCLALARGGPGLRPAARLFEPETGRLLELATTQPGLQVYGGNFLDGTLVGRRRIAYGQNSGLCLETQHFPDSPNQPAFPTTRLDPGERYHHSSVLSFSCE